MDESFILTHGLTNRKGENNCFINAVIQILWHLDLFRRHFVLLQVHECVSETECLFCTLKGLFINFKYNDSITLPPNFVRNAMALCYANKGRFKLGEMDNAIECYESILKQLHLLITNSDWTASCVSDKCITHNIFSHSLCENDHCECGAISEPFTSRDILFYISSSNILKSMKKLKFKRKDILNNGTNFGRVLHECLALDNLNCPDTKCKKSAKKYYYLLHSPHIISLSISWPTDSTTGSQVLEFMNSIGHNIDISQMFDHNMDETSNSKNYKLVGIICYYGRHYSAFVYHSNFSKWVFCDDATFKEVGDDWNIVVEKFKAARYQPELFVYASEYVNFQKEMKLTSSLACNSTNNYDKNSSSSTSQVLNQPILPPKPISLSPSVYDSISSSYATSHLNDFDSKLDKLSLNYPLNNNHIDVLPNNNTPDYTDYLRTNITTSNDASPIITKRTQFNDNSIQYGNNNSHSKHLSTQINSVITKTSDNVLPSQTETSLHTINSDKNPNYLTNLSVYHNQKAIRNSSLATPYNYASLLADRDDTSNLRPCTTGNSVTNRNTSLLQSSILPNLVNTPPVLTFKQFSSDYTNISKYNSLKHELKSNNTLFPHSSGYMPTSNIGGEVPITSYSQEHTKKFSYHEISSQLENNLAQHATRKISPTITKNHSHTQSITKKDMATQTDDSDSDLLQMTNVREHNGADMYSGIINNPDNFSKDTPNTFKALTSKNTKHKIIQNHDNSKNSNKIDDNYELIHTYTSNRHYNNTSQLSSHNTDSYLENHQGITKNWEFL